jgi:FMN phosphatase YigB (HAD superfamily)
MKSRKKSKPGQNSDRLVFLFDVDNTLLDNDRVVDDLRRYLRKEVGLKKCQRYWNIFERRREECGFADYLGALQQYREEYPHDMHLLAVSKYLIGYPFRDRLFPGGIKAIQHVQRWGQTALLTDGDVVFQPHKVQRAGLDKVVGGRVLIYIHKEKELKDVAAHYPADHYVVIDDKLRILTSIKKSWGNRVTTVFARQGHYARDPKTLSSCPPADIDIKRIGDLLNHDLKSFLLSIVLIGALLTCSAGEPTLPQQGSTTSTNANHARLHPSYQVFVAQTHLPEIKGLNRVLTIGERSTVDFDKPSQVTTKEKSQLSELLEVPPEVVSAQIQKLSTNHQLKDAELAHEFQIAVIDYRYLSQRWARYRPPVGKELVKAEAIKCLQAGNLEKAWQMYIDLPRPRPPKGSMRITSAPGVTN